ncbi:hypothetical protein IJI76_01085 [Candidatus Saccharibacteria bacterium]|nr:hypothetical protein [Candidatus Saccharibacteria bacterium]
MFRPGDCGSNPAGAWRTNPADEFALSKDRALELYIPKARQFLERGLANGADESRVRGCFYNTCEYVKRRDFLGEDRTQVAEFYRHRGKMLGIDTSFITPDAPCSIIMIDWMSAFWEKIKPFAFNPALNKFLFESKVIRSRLIWCFLANPHGYLGNELIYRNGFDPLGLWIERDTEENTSAWPYHNGLYAYRGLRDWQIAQVILNADNILVFNGSSMPELRLTGYIGSHFDRFLEQTFYVADSDPCLDFDFLMLEYPEKVKSRIKYHHMSNSEMIVEMLNQNKRFDLIYAKDILFSAPKSIKSLVQAAMGLLEPGGFFLFDLPLNHFAVVRDAYLFSSSEKDLEICKYLEDLTGQEVIKLLSDITSRLDISLSQVETDFAIDEGTGEKYGVGVIIKKEGSKVKKI